MLYKDMRALIALDWARHVETDTLMPRGPYLIFNEMGTNDRAIPRQRRVAGTSTTQEGAAPYETRPTSAAPNRPRTARLLRPVTSRSDTTAERPSCCLTRRHSPTRRLRLPIERWLVARSGTL